MVSAVAASSGVAMALIGLLYTGGDGVPQDYAKASKWFHRAMKSSNPQVAAWAKTELNKIGAGGGQ